MRIVQINCVCGKGSTGKICVAVSEILSRKGVENYILYSRWTSNYPQAIKYENDKYAKFQALNEKLFGTFGFESKRSTMKLIRYIEEIQPDIVHLHVLHSHDCNLTMLFNYLRGKRIKVFWTFHDCWAITAYCPYFDMIGCQKWKTGCNNCPSWRRFSWLIDRSVELYARKKAIVEGIDLTIITPSEWMANVVKESFLKDHPIKVINNGIDLKVFKPYENQWELTEFKAKYGLEGRLILLGVADVWGERKGLEDFIRLRNLLDQKYLIVLVGVTENIQKKLPRGIVGINRTRNQRELAHIYAAADIFVNPTYEDNYPTTNLEAMACGTPVITYRTGGSPESVTPETGWVVDKGDIETVANVILCSGHKDIDKMRKECRKRAVGCFDMYKCFESYVGLYK